MDLDSLYLRKDILSWEFKKLEDDAVENIESNISIIALFQLFVNHEHKIIRNDLQDILFELLAKSNKNTYPYYWKMFALQFGLDEFNSIVDVLDYSFRENEYRLLLSIVERTDIYYDFVIDKFHEQLRLLDRNIYLDEDVVDILVFLLNDYDVNISYRTMKIMIAVSNWILDYGQSTIIKKDLINAVLNIYNKRVHMSDSVTDIIRILIYCIVYFDLDSKRIATLLLQQRETVIQMKLPNGTRETLTKLVQKYQREP